MVAVLLAVVALALAVAVPLCVYVLQAGTPGTLGLSPGGAVAVTVVVFLVLLPCVVGWRYLSDREADSRSNRLSHGRASRHGRILAHDPSQLLATSRRSAQSLKSRRAGSIWIVCVNRPGGSLAGMEVVVRVRHWIVLSVVVLASVGCGKSTTPAGQAASTSTTSIVGAGTEATASATAKQAFLDQGNSICKQMNSQSSALTASYGPKGPTTSAQEAEMLNKNGDLIEGSVKQIQALAQPPGDEAKLASMYAEVMQLASYSRELGAAVSQGSSQAAKDLQSKGSQLQSTVNPEFTAYGLTECGKG